MSLPLSFPHAGSRPLVALSHSATNSELPGEHAWVCVGRFVHGTVMTGRTATNLRDGRNELGGKAGGADGHWTLAVRDGRLHFYGVASAGEQTGAAAAFDYDIEDARIYGEHAIALVCGNYTRIFVDGYEVWASEVRLVGEPEAHQGSLRAAPITGTDPDEVATEIRDMTPPPKPLIRFAAPALAPADAGSLVRRRELVIHAKFRVRGPGQYGTIVAAGTTGTPAISAYIDGARGIQLTCGADELWAHGNWSDGRWHYLTLAWIGGAAQIWVDGWLHAHSPGTLPEFDELAIGQDLAGNRLMGEVGEGGIYGPLTDQQIALLAHRTALSQVPVFDSFPTGAYHRIPALTRTREGTLLAFADRRRDLPNDAPNATDLVLRRSTDNGRTWSDVQLVASFPGTGTDGVAVTDAAAVQDSTGRIHVLADFYPAHTGLLTALPGSGMDERGIFLDGPALPGTSNAESTANAGIDLAPESTSDADSEPAPDGSATTDNSASRYIIPGNWPTEPTAVVDLQGNPTPWTVDADGALTKSGEPAGNVLIDAELRAQQTAHIAQWTSDDDGVTWSPMRLITNQVKEPWMTFLGIGPGNGIRIDSPTGRLIVPCYFSTADGTQHSAATLISDDDGRTWRRGPSPNDGRIVDGESVDPASFTDPQLTMTESAIVHAGGELLMFSRSQHPRVLRTRSVDGGESWGDVVEDPALREIFCQPAAVLADDGALVFANASRMLPYRGCGTVYRAQPGTHWVARAVNPRHHGYQSLAALPGGDVVMLWERETAGIWLTRIPADIFQ